MTVDTISPRFRFFAPLLLASMMVASPLQAKEVKGSVSIKFAGEQDWTATCSFTKMNGKEREISRKGRGSRSVQSLAVRGISKGSCALSIPEGSEVKVTFNSKGDITCPFKESDQCVEVLVAGGTTTFSF